MTDADGNPLTYTVTAPTRGTVEHQRSGRHIHVRLHTESGRKIRCTGHCAGGLRPVRGISQWLMCLDDCQRFGPVFLPILVTPAFVTYLPAGTDPGGVTVVGDRAYMLNPGNNTVTILTSRSVSQRNLNRP